jgi:hypothetical protein
VVRVIVLGIITQFHSLLFSLSLFICHICNFIVCEYSLMLLLHILLLQFRGPLCQHRGIIHLHLFLVALLYVTLSVGRCY